MEKIANILITVFAVSIWLYWLIYCNTISKEIHDKFTLNSINKNIFGFDYDYTDHQWRNFRENLPIIVIINLVFLLVFHLLLQKTSKSRTKTIFSIISLLFGIVLHGQKVLYLLSFIIFYYYFTLNCYYKNIKKEKQDFLSFVQTFLAWTFPCLLKILAEKYDGFQNIFEFFDFKLLDWNSCFNLVLLRLISFHLEFKSSKIELNKLSSLNEKSIELNNNYNILKNKSGSDSFLSSNSTTLNSTENSFPKSKI